MKYLFHIFMLFTLAACGSASDEPRLEVPTTPEVPVVPDDPAQQPLAFVPQSSSVSRATDSPMQESYDVFKIWSYKHTSSTTTENVMPGYRVKYLNDTELWQYDGNKYTTEAEFANPIDGHDRQYLKYWDGSAQSYTFYAFVPVTLPDVTCGEDGLNIPNITAHTLVASSNEVLIAQHRRDISVTLQDVDELDTNYSFSLSNFHDNVPLRFHHLFSRVTFKIYNSGSLPAELLRGNVKLNDGAEFITTGNFVKDHWVSTGASDATNNTLTAFEFQTPKVLKANGTVNDAETLTSMCELSQTITSSDTSTITVSLTLNNTVVERTFYLPNAKWEFDKDYIYYLNIQVGEGSPILINLSLDEFSHNEGDDVDETQTNW